MSRPEFENANELWADRMIPYESNLHELSDEEIEYHFADTSEARDELHDWIDKNVFNKK